MTANAAKINEASPKGTGEDDYALLVVTSKTDGTPITSPVTYIAPEINSDVEPGTSVLEIAYPADYLDGDLISRELYSSSAVSQIEGVYSYDGVTKEFIALGGSVVAQHGSSGGAIVDTAGKLIAIITSVTEESSTDKRELGAITLVHIDKSIRQSSVTLTEFLISDAHNLADQFEVKLRPSLTRTLVGAITERP
jgi:S1-C subfamily serine protease